MYIVIFLVSINSLFSQSIISLDTIYEQSKPLRFKYTGGTGAATDWIGIYKTGQKPGAIASTIWKYIASSSGEIEFTNNLDTGRYDVHLFCCDGYRILASIIGLKINPAGLRSIRKYYLQKDSLNFYSGLAKVNDFITIYDSANWLNGKPTRKIDYYNSRRITKVDNLSLAPVHDPGRYYAVLYSNAEEIKNIDSFEVKSIPTLPDQITRIGLGSCSNQNAPMPTMLHAIDRKIDLFIYAGDNVYIDSYDTTVIKNKYTSFLNNRVEYQKLRASVPVLATWDDHDYACCDEDKDNPVKDNSQRLFLDFYNEPSASIRRKQKGIHTSYIQGPDGKKLQIILLDTRYFLDDKRKNNGCGQNDYCAWAGPGDQNKTILGSEQWQWLKEELLKPADLRMIVSSIQFSSSYTGWEGWSIFPYERSKMQSLIKETKADHVFFVSGDIHYADVSKLNDDLGQVYPLYDFTASALNQSWPPEINANRVDNKSYRDANVGIIDINWADKKLIYNCIDDQNKLRFSHTLPFKEISFLTTTNEVKASKEKVLRQIPCPGLGSIRLASNAILTGKIEVYSSAGIKLKSLNLVKFQNIEIQGLNSGVFFVKFISSNEKIGVIKTIVQ